MRKLGLLLLFLLTSTSALAKWAEVNGGGARTNYVDPSTIRASGSKTKMWGITDFKTAQTLNDMRYLSLAHQQEYDCKEETNRLLASTYYTGNMGTGEVIYSDSDVGSKPAPVMPGTIGEVLFRTACDNK